MSAPPDDFWLLAPLRVARTAELLAMISQAQAAGHAPSATVLGTNDRRRAWLAAAREAEWSRRAAPPRASSRPVRCEITAAEVNAWLRDLPVERPDP